MDMMNIEMNGQSVMHQAFNGETGYQMQMGNKQDLSQDELTESKETKGIVPQLFYKQNGFKLEVAGVEKVADKDAYKVKVTSPSGKTTNEYYDVATGYLLREEKTISAGGQQLQQTIDNNNYSKEGNIVLPHSISISVQSTQGNQDFTIEIKDVKFNEGVTTEDFK
jgi:zinc protease